MKGASAEYVIITEPSFEVPSAPVAKSPRAIAWSASTTSTRRRLKSLTQKLVGSPSREL
jgi:hypothetical protein